MITLRAILEMTTICCMMGLIILREEIYEVPILWL